MNKHHDFMCHTDSLATKLYEVAFGNPHLVSSTHYKTELVCVVIHSPLDNNDSFITMVTRFFITGLQLLSTLLLLIPSYKSQRKSDGILLVSLIVPFHHRKVRVIVGLFSNAI